jgi:hypothetical protein
MTILDPVQLPTTRRAIRTTGKLPVAAVILPLGNEQCGGSPAKLNDDSALERSALPPPIKLEAKETKAVAGAGRTSRYPRFIRPTLIRCPGDSPASGHRGDREKCQTATLMKTSRCCQSHRADSRTSFGRVAAGTAAALPSSVIPPNWRGNLPTPVLEAGWQELIA